MQIIQGPESESTRFVFMVLRELVEILTRMQFGGLPCFQFHRRRILLFGKSSWQHGNYKNKVSGRKFPQVQNFKSKPISNRSGSETDRNPTNNLC